MDLVRAYSNRPDLCEELEQAVASLRSAQVNQDYVRQSVRSCSPPRVRLLGDRLTDDAVSELLERYQQGTTYRELAEQFKISTTSVKKTLKINRVTRRGHKYRH